MLQQGVWDGFIAESGKRVAFVLRVKCNDEYFTGSGIVCCCSSCPC